VKGGQCKKRAVQNRDEGRKAPTLTLLEIDLCLTLTFFPFREV
jgi:hypothetical protein